MPNFRLPFAAHMFPMTACQASLHKRAMAGINVVSVGSMRPKGKSYDINVFQVSRRNSTNTTVQGS